MNRAIEYCYENDKFFVRYHSPRRDFFDMRTEFFYDALRISEQLGKVYIAFSGGVDSQIIARCFIDQNLPCELVFIHVVGYNDEELVQVRRCEQFFGPKVTIFELDLESKKEEWLARASTEPYAAMHQYQFKWLCERLPEDWPIITQGMVEPAIVGSNSLNVSIYHNYNEEMECRFRLMSTNRQVVDFPYSPEAIASYYTDERMRTFCRTFLYYQGDCPRTQHYNMYAKAMVKGFHFPDVIWYPKLSGYENFPDWIKTTYNYDTKVAVPYWDVSEFMMTEMNSTKEYRDWNFK